MSIKIKGKSKGLFEIEIQLNSSYADIKDAIGQKLSKNKLFFIGAGAKVLITGGMLSETQKKDISGMLRTEYGVTRVTFASEAAMPVKRSEPALKAANEDTRGKERVKIVAGGCFDAKSIFVAHTLRSGQRVECEGDIVVLGDVNDGAEVIAGGSIAVMGALRGLVHAGATGRNDVVIAANALMPKQLRISGKIAIFPDNRQPAAPEIAQYKQGSIVIRPLKPQRR